MLSGHPGISPWVASPRGPKERDNIRGWTVKTVTIAKSDRSTLPSTPSLGDLVKTFLIRKPLHQGWLRRLPLYQWKGYRNGNNYSESSSSIVARAPSGQLLLVIVSLEGKSLSAGHKHSAALIAAASTSVGLHVYVYDVL